MQRPKHKNKCFVKRTQARKADSLEAEIEQWKKYKG